MRHSSISILAVLCVSACGEETPIETCTDHASQALRTCVADYSQAIADCYTQTDAPCLDGNEAQASALSQLEETLDDRCAEGEFGTLSQEGLTGRLQNACSSEASSMAWRVYGGPHGAVWEDADDATRACLQEAHQLGTSLVDSSLALTGACLANGQCDPDHVTTMRAAAEASAASAVADACPQLATIIAIDASTYVDRLHQQVDCITAAGAPSTAPLHLNCGPENAQFDAARGEWTQVIVDGDEWGTLCGDGTDYAFYVRLAPEGEPLDKVVIGLQGGGVCVFEEDCAAKLASAPTLFNAQDEIFYGTGVMADDPDDNPFGNWTKLYLPYCTQDVHIGGGVTEDLGSVQLPRYGSVNARASIQMVRDLIWKKMDAEGGDGFRPDKVQALFGGWSAGSYGTMYNYHWMLDDLQWPRTVAFPDAGLGFDNKDALGVAGLGLLKIPAWGALPNLPPYCFDGRCAVGPVIFEALSPRLLQVPEQQMLVMTNPRDQTQMYDAYFFDEVYWLNTLRESYCETKDLPGIKHYYTSISDQSIHTITLRDELYTGSVDGESMRDWMWRAVSEPETLVNRVEEANFVTDIPGVEPYPCDVAP